MMKFRLSLLIALMAICLTSVAQDVAPKREMRSAWVATVWRLDWPQTLITSSGNAAQIAAQKKEMTQMLDSLALNNFNCINFQVRSRADAFYRSSYEPWSSDLVSTRGMDPGYDPLEFVVEECHKRGMECHAWVNPYRFESVKGSWSGQAGDYRTTHPDWIMDVEKNGSTPSILNPGLPEVTDLICKIIKEIVDNYDIDGVLFDDYFYLSGTSTSHDGDLYNKYTAAGGKLSIGDWRRDNVNRMVASVYSTIKSAKPWVRFGVSPAGIACTSSSVAKKYGISPCPTGSDWQYNDIYSDPIAWISQKSLDFISPQVYWTIGNGTDYDKATKWWGQVCEKFGRHLYVSHSISSLNGSSKAPAMSGAEADIAMMSAPAKASGSRADEFVEYADEVRLNRLYSPFEAPGSIFYSAKYLYRTARTFSHYLRNTVFGCKALVPSCSWDNAPTPAMVTGLTRNGSRLQWNRTANMRYTIYAFPSNMPAANFLREPEYLVGVSYTGEFTIPSEVLTGHQYAVCAYDRYGNESSPVLLGVPTTPLGAATLLAPIGGARAEAPFEFSWSAVDGASEYIVEICSDRAMTQRIDQRSTTTTSISTEAFHQLPIDTELYWRVRSCGAGKADGISKVEAFTAANLLILSPENGTTEVSLTPTFVYSIPDRKVTIEISKKDEFTDGNIVYTAEGNGGSITIPRYTLAAGTNYYARMLYQRAGVDMVTAVVSFTTTDVAAAVPAIAHPVAGGTLHADEVFVTTPVDGATLLRLEVSSTETFSSRTSYVATVSANTFADTKAASEIKVAGKLLADGAKYYVRARATYNKADGTSENSDFCAPVSFIYSATPAGITSPTVSAMVEHSGRTISVVAPVEAISLYAVDGTEVMSAGAMQPGAQVAITAADGVYILMVKADGKSASQKIVVK